jgi:NADH dehydrogenase
MASVARFRAVASIGPVRVAGVAGWLLWAFVHLTFLTGFKNRFSALAHWAVSFLGRSRAERTITARQVALTRKTGAPDGGGARG